MSRMFFILGAVLCFLGVGLGAFGAHFLKGRISPDMAAVFETGVRYQMYHGLALLGVAIAVATWPHPLVSIAAWCFAVGTFIFSGSLYVLALTGIRELGAITPIGGLVLLTGWATLAVGLLKFKP